MSDPRAALLSYLRHAAQCYGEDLPLPVRARRQPVRPDRPPAATEPVDAPPAAPASTVSTTGAPTTGAPTTGAPTTEAPATVAPAADPSAALAALQHEVAPCTKCKLAKSRTNLVFGEGSATADVMFIGEAPGQMEDATGRPFVGKAGKLLDKIIENAMGLRREDVFIANINKCRPPGNRDPEPDEIAACLPWLRAQIALIQPKVVVTLGRIALWNLLGVTQPMKRMRGRTLLYEGTPVIPTWHPAYLLREPSAKADTWEDIKRVNRLLGHPEVPPRPAQPGS